MSVAGLGLCVSLLMLLRYLQPITPEALGQALAAERRKFQAANEARDLHVRFMQCVLYKYMNCKRHLHY